MKNQIRDFELETIVGNMLISQYQSHILKSRIADRLDKWSVLAQDRSKLIFINFQSRKKGIQSFIACK